ncbi:MAG: hypothetical protein Q8P86_03790 [bacterium]|nr:hypothetical protein [bacterium]
MTLSKKGKIKSLPDSPGVYFFLGKRGEILYIGKATSLKDRVGSYWSGDILKSRGVGIAKMLGEIKEVQHKKTDSVLEALLLEVDLIKKFLPKYNVREKDDKSFNCVVVTDENFPRVLLARKRELDSQMLSTFHSKTPAFFGPFPNGLELRQALKIIKKIFPYRDKCVPNQGKPCFNRQIGLCPGVCTGEISEKEYAKTIRNIKMFFKGKKKGLITLLEKEMKSKAKAREFEKAGNIRNTISALKHIRDISLLKRENFKIKAKDFRIEAYDIAHTSGVETVGAFTVIENGALNKKEYRLFKIKGQHGVNDTAGLREILRRRFVHPEWKRPDLVVVDGNEVQKKTAENQLAVMNISIPVVAVVKDKRHKPAGIIGDGKIIKENEKTILLANSEAHRFVLRFHRKRRGRIA